jgi:hypothetical protein
MMTNNKTLNFWEAREAALEGKTVKRLTAEDEFCNYDSKDFLTRSMAPCEVNGHWEIVEEPKLTTSYHNVYKYAISGSWDTLEKAREILSLNILSQIAITVDENGKLIEARNV